MKKVLFFLLTVMLCIPLTMRAQSSLTVADGTATNSYVPVYGFYCDATQHSQIIYPESLLTDMAGKVIDSLIFYSSSSSVSWGSIVASVKLAIVTDSVFSSTTFSTASMTTVYTGTLSISNYKMALACTDQFVYTSGHLLVDVQVTTPDDYSSAYFYGLTSTGSSIMSYYDYTPTSQNFLPKLTFAYSVPPTCPNPTTVAISNVSDNSADLSWVSTGTESNWDIYLATTATDVPDASSTPTYTSTSTTYTLSGLTSSTNYYVYVRANCGAGDVSNWRGTSFLTSQIAAELPYSQDFEDVTENANWTLTANGVNQWIIGTAVNYTPAGEYGLYVSNDSGLTSNYSNGSTSNSWAYRDIDFGTTYAEYEIAFKFKGVGESCCDYVKVFLGAPATPQGESTPAGATLLGQYNMQSDWVQKSIVVNSTHQGAQRLYFMWRNDGSVGTNPAGIIDDITIVGKSCGTPRDLAVDSVTTTTIAVSFTPALSTDDAWDIIILNAGDTIDESLATPITSTSYEFTGLTADSPYQIYVRTDCGSENSFWTSVLSVRTACPDYMSIPYAESFDTYGTGSSSSYPSCWTKLASGSYPYITASNPSSAPGCLYFYGYSSSYSTTYSCAVTPEIDTVTNPLNTLSVNFKIKKTSTSTGAGGIQVGVLSDPTDLTSFQLVQSYSGTEWANANEWYEVEVPLTSFTGSGSHIAIYKPATSSNYTYIDDFNVYVTPTCLKPMDVTFSQVTDNSVTVGWTARSSESAWSVVIVPTGDTPESGVAEQVYTNPYTITNLTDNTTYDVYVKADCGGGDESPWSSVATFTTRCLPTSTIPYVENFDSNGTGTAAFPSCWDRMTNNTSTYPYISASSYSGAGALYFYCSSSYYSLATSQALDLSAFSANSLMLSFKAKKTSTSYGRLDVGVMTDPTNLNTMTVLKSIYPTDYAANNTWCDFEVILPAAYETGNVYLAFLAPQGGSSYVYVDTVTLDNAPTCMAPSNLQVSNVAGASANLSWDAPQVVPGSYTVEYSEAQQENWVTASSSVVGTSYVISGLQPQTAYDVRVSSNCESGEADPIVANFLTGCLAGGEINVGTGTSTTSYLPTNGCYRYSLSQQMFTAADMNGSSTLTGVKFYVSTTTNDTRNVTIYLGNTTQSSVSTSTYIPTGTQTQVFSGSLPTSTSGWVEIQFTTPFSYTGGNMVLTVDDNTGAYVCTPSFQAHSGSSIYYYSDSSNPDPSQSSPCSFNSTSYRNNVIFMGNCDSTVTCIAPVAQIAGVDDESIIVSWVPGYNESSWEMEYKTASEATWTSQGTVTSSPVTLSGLTANTAYNIRMRSDCSGEYSDWVTLNAQTECASIAALPYTQDFETATGSGAGNFISCWQRGTNGSTAYPYTSNSQHHGGSYSLYFYGSSSSYSYAATPRFDDEIDMDNLQISFYARKTSAAYNIEVGIMTDPTDYSTFQLIGSFSPEETSTWELAEINTDTYTGNGHYVAFRQPQYTSNYMYIDDIDIHEIPFCGRVENITASNITTTSATVSWTPGGNESSWEVVYGISGTVDLTTAVPTPVSTPSIDLTGLTPSSPYDIYVRIDCGDGEYGAWTQEDFRTACGLVNIPFSEGFESFATGSTADMPCWTRSNTYTSSNYPYVSNSYANTGSKSMYFYSSSSSYNMLVTPQFESTVAMNTLQVAFSIRASSTTGSQMIVGVMSNPSDASTFVGIDTVAATTANTWQFFEVPLTSYTGTGKYVAFMNYNTGYYSIYLDDVTVDAIPSCPRPSNVVATSSATDTVTLVWTDATGTMWDVIYGPTGFDPATSTEATTIEGLTTTSCVIDGLTAGVIYDFYVRSDCGGGDVSPWSYMPGTASPYTITMGVTGTRTVTGCGMTVTDDGGANGNYSNYCNYILTINPSDPDSLLTISGTFAGESSIDYLSIYEGTTVNEANLIQKVYSTMNGGSSGSTVNFGPFTSEAGPLTLKFYSDVSVNYQGFTASVNCVAAPTCRKPLNITTQAVTSTDATLAWTTVSENYVGFNIAVSTVPTFNPDTCTMTYTSTSTSYQITGLNSNTIYYAMIQTDCGSGDESDWSDVYTFMTAANAATVPYLSDFSQTTEVADWVFFNGTQINKWHIGTPSGEASPILFISNDNGTSSSYSTSSTSNVWACRDINFGNFAEYELSFKWRALGESCCDYFKVYIGDPGVVTAGSTTVPTGAVQLGGTMNNNASYTTYTVSLDGTYSNTTKRLYFLWHNDASVGSNPPANIDSIQIIGMTCGRPHTLHLSSATQTTANIGFIPGMSTDVAWEYAYGPAGSSVEGLTPVAVSDTLIQLTGLSASTAYVIYVRTDCGAGEYSAWSNALNFFTECGLATIPYTETFDSYGSGSQSYYPNCWARMSTYSGSYPYISSTSYAGAGSLYFYAGTNGTYNIGVTPQMDLTSTLMSDLQVKFQYRPSSSSSRMIVGVMTDPADATTFVGVDTVTGTAYTWNERTVYLSSYTGTGAYVAFKNEYNNGTSYGYVDNVEIDEAPTCLPIASVTATGLSTTTASVEWTEVVTGNAWNIEYGPVGFTQGSGTTVAATTNPYTLTGLTASTSYDVYVQVDCGGGDVSAWSNVAHFSTFCDAVSTFPYTEGFENAGNIPACWDQSYGTDNVDWEFQAGDYGSSISGAHSGSYNAYFFDTDGASTKLVSPIFDLTQVSTPYVSFWHAQVAWGGDQDQLTVYYRTSTTGTWTQLATYTSSISTWTFDSLSLPNPSATYQIAFQGLGDYGYGVVLDDITVANAGSTPPAPETCDAPTGVTASSITYNSASINWTPGGDETAWNLQYKKATETSWSNNIAVTSRPYALNNLDAETAYNVRVQANCGAGETSEWSTVANFTTAAAPVDPCDAPTNLQISSITQTSAVATWTAGGDETAWNVQYKLSSATEWYNATVSTPTYTIEGLSPESEYTVQVQAKCSETNLSGWVSKTFTTLSTGVSSVELANSISIMPNPAESYIELTINSNVNVKEATIYNAFGQMIQKVALNDNHARIDVSNMAAGMYFVRIANDNNMATKKFIKK